MDRQMTPFGNTVVLSMIGEPRERPSAIVLPQGARVRYDAPLMARVVDCGPDVRDVAPGMEVLIRAHNDGAEVEIPGAGHFRLVSERAVLCVLSHDRPDAALIADYARLWRQIMVRAKFLAIVDPEASEAYLARVHAVGAEAIEAS